MATVGRHSRRAFLRTLIPALAALAGCWRYLTPRRRPREEVLAVPLADVPPDGALVLPEDGVAVTRDRDGVLDVLDLTCTHLGCRVRGTEHGFACPCHGSRFDRHGRVLSGPAGSPLHRVPFCREGSTLHIRREKPA